MKIQSMNLEDWASSADSGEFHIETHKDSLSKQYGMFGLL